MEIHFALQNVSLLSCFTPSYIQFFFFFTIFVLSATGYLSNVDIIIIFQKRKKIFLTFQVTCCENKDVKVLQQPLLLRCQEDQQIIATRKTR